MNSTQVAQPQTHWIQFLQNEDLSTSNKNMSLDKESNSVKFSDRKIADYAKICEEINRELNDIPAQQKVSFNSLLAKNITLINSKIESHNNKINFINNCFGIFSRVFGLFIDMNLYKPVSSIDVFEYTSTHLEKIAMSSYELYDYNPHENTDEPFYKPFIEVNGNTYLIRFRYKREGVYKKNTEQQQYITVMENFTIASAAKIFPCPKDKFTYFKADREFDTVSEMVDDYMVRHQLTDKTQLIRLPDDFLEECGIKREVNPSENQDAEHKE